jgi:hypothetical protein
VAKQLAAGIGNGHVCAHDGLVYNAHPYAAKTEADTLDFNHATVYVRPALRASTPTCWGSAGKTFRKNPDGPLSAGGQHGGQITKLYMLLTLSCIDIVSD